jgi:hypothetical protein
MSLDIEIRSDYYYIIWCEDIHIIGANKQSNWILINMSNITNILQICKIRGSHRGGYEEVLSSGI